MGLCENLILVLLPPALGGHVLVAAVGLSRRSKAFCEWVVTQAYASRS